MQGLPEYGLREMTGIWKYMSIYYTENSKHLVSLFNTIRTKDRVLNVSRKNVKGKGERARMSLNTPEWEVGYGEITRTPA